MMKRYSVAFGSLLLISALAYGQDNSKGSTPGAASSPSKTLPQKQAIKRPDSSSNLKEPLSRGQQVLKMKHQYIYPILNDIWSHPVSCKKLLDEENAFQKLQRLHENENVCSKTIKDIMNDGSMVEIITPELERQIESQDIICSGWPNKSTVSKFASIWKESPCSEAGVTALIQIDAMLYNNYISFINADYYQKDNFPYRNEFGKTLQFIIDNYPESLETEVARYNIASINYKLESAEMLTATERWTTFILNNTKSLSNRYYILILGNRNTVREFRGGDLGYLYHTYLDNCNKYSLEGIAKDGKLPPEAIDMYNRHRQLIENDRKVFPSYYKKMDGFPRCYKYIEKYAPSQVKHSKAELAHPEKDK